MVKKRVKGKIRVKKGGNKDINRLGYILNKLWIAVVIVSFLLIIFGTVVNYLSLGVVLLAPEDSQISVEVVSDNGSFKSAVNFLLVGVIGALFIVTLILLIVFLLKHRKEKALMVKQEIPNFDVFGMQHGLKTA
mgnify:CR=1 FL=1